MTLLEVKTLVNSLNDEQLKQELQYLSSDRTLSGVVDDILIAKQDLYWDGEDDPSELKTKKELIKDGYEKEDIDGMVIEIPANSFYILITA